MPRFSIIVALYNQHEYLPLLVQALNTQSFKDFEVHFCDDGSTDPTKGFFDYASSEKVMEFPWEYHHQENTKSYAKAMNMGVRAAKGEYCVFIAGDSFPEPDYLEILDEHVAPHRLICGIRVQVDNGQGVDLDWRLKKNNIPTFSTICASKPWELMTGNGLTIPTAALKEYGAWREDFIGYGGEDNEIIGRFYFHGYVCWSVPDLRLYHHWHKARGIYGPSNNKALAALTQYASYGF